MNLRDLLLWALLTVELLAGLPALYLGLVACAALVTARRRVEPVGAARQGAAGIPRFAFVVPAHDEERVIGELLQSLAALDYPRERFDVFVVADNCTDATAEVVRAFGRFAVFERQDAAKRGKGYALNWMFARLDAEGQAYDAYVIVDADSVVSADFLKVMARELARGARVIQAQYSVGNPLASMSTTLRWLALTLVNHVRPLGRNALGGPAVLTGNGMCFAHDVVARHPWEAFGLTEDRQYYLTLVEHGEFVRYAPDALVRSDMPTTFGQMRTQDVRWGADPTRESRWRAAGRLCRLGIRTRRIAPVEAALEHLTPPLSVIVFICLLLTGAAVVLGAGAPFVVAGALWLGLLMYVGSVFILLRPPAQAYMALLRVPGFFAWKVWVFLVLKRRQQRAGEWVRTARTPTTTQEAPAEDQATALDGRPDRPKVLLVISLQPPPGLRDLIAAGREPRRDYFALQDVLGADFLYPNDAAATRAGRLIGRLLGPRQALVWEAFRRRKGYDVLYTDAEVIGLPLALLLKVARSRPGQPRHVALAHNLSSRAKRLFFALGAGSHINTLIVHSTAQEKVAARYLRGGKTQIVKLPYFVDTRFWSLDAGTVGASHTDPRYSDRPLICSTGQECRDFATLAHAVTDIAVNVRLTAGSASTIAGASEKRRRRADHQSASLASVTNLPPNLLLGRCKDYADLRELYAASRFVVVPLQSVSFQAGVTVILEAMAMGKAVIVSAVPGQTDVVRNLRTPTRPGDYVGDAFTPAFVAPPYAEEAVGKLSTGIYVAPGDPAALHAAIEYLLDHPDDAEMLGRNARQVAERCFSIEQFARRFASAILGQQPPLLVPDMPAAACSDGKVGL